MTHILAAAHASNSTNLDEIARESVFWILAVASVGAALAMILVRRAVHCALMLAVVMLCLATFYAMQGAPLTPGADEVDVRVADDGAGEAGR